jgi:hypothetical protein
MLCAKHCAYSCDECVTPAHRVLWTLCDPGQNTLNCSRLYEKRSLMWIVSSNSLGNYICEVIFSKTGNVTGTPYVL